MGHPAQHIGGETGPIHRSTCYGTHLLRHFHIVRSAPVVQLDDRRRAHRPDGPGAPAYTRASFVIEDRVPGLHQTADNPLPSALRGAPPSVDPGRQTVEQETARP
ncbi:hypothetical protein O7631_30430 [Micromonospora sp. WMMD967]|uniref:hypothetical protein n=1 Tax=Micromonospora sp. WMMD967 TaxID=3016101 RepID=UPI0024172163|nr:hypothetical protein [Micromonospora sp. WMMD967]MDG4840864.1 hypothetical protein [Micromonospora sp. WMMD967]